MFASTKIQQNKV